jgi:hypothetical protein
MMTTIIKENGITFKELEQNIFRDICKIGQTCTKEFLEQYDKLLMKQRDRSKYRHKGTRKTTVKTVYGEVEYRRAVYETSEEDGTRRYVYLLDETLELDNIGLISTNMAELLVKSVTEMSYRETAARVTEMTGQSISAMGVWNVIQALGEKVCEDEHTLVKEHKAGHIQGVCRTPVLFEEADGVYVNLQGKDRVENRQNKAEIKVAIAYDGWKKEGRDRYRLHERVAAAGFAKSREFQDCREAVIAERFNLDEVETRILNGDGGSWIKKVKDPETVFQLDPFHRNKAVRERIHDKKAQRDILDLLNEKDIDGVFRYLRIYRNSLGDDQEIEDAEALLHYYENNRKGLLPYQAQLETMPDAPEGIEYLNLGTMENHIWSIIARRMKHNHTSWSKRGGNHLAKILAKKCSGKLYEVTEKLRRPVFEEEKAQPLYERIIMSAKAPKKDGKGYAYPVMGHLIGLDMSTRGDRRKLNAMAGC